MQYQIISYFNGLVQERRKTITKALELVFLALTHQYLTIFHRTHIYQHSTCLIFIQIYKDILVQTVDWLWWTDSYENIVFILLFV